METENFSLRVPSAIVLYLHFKHKVINDDNKSLEI